MNTYKKSIILLTLMASLFWLAGGCASNPYERRIPPAWAMKGSGAYEISTDKVFYGVGMASDIKQKALLYATADNRARAEVAKILDTYVDYLFRDYMTSLTAEGSGASVAAEQQEVTQLIKTTVKVRLKGAQIVDRWQDPKTGILYSLCRWELQDVKTALVDDTRLDAGLRDFIDQNAEKVHEIIEEDLTE